MRLSRLVTPGYPYGDEEYISSRESLGTCFINLLKNSATNHLGSELGDTYTVDIFFKIPIDGKEIVETREHPLLVNGKVVTVERSEKTYMDSNTDIFKNDIEIEEEVFGSYAVRDGRRKTFFKRDELVEIASSLDCNILLPVLEREHGLIDEEHYAHRGNLVEAESGDNIPNLY